jgi:hypothetical protein
VGKEKPEQSFDVRVASGFGHDVRRQQASAPANRNARRRERGFAVTRRAAS